MVRLPVDAESVARALGFPDPDEDTKQAVDEAIAEAEAEVVGYLGREIVPTQYTAAGLWPWPTGWELPETPLVRIVSTTPDVLDGVPVGTFTVVYEAGLDYASVEGLAPIRRYVRASAMANPVLLAYLERAKGAVGAVTTVSVSTEGQSKTITRARYGGIGSGAVVAPGSGAPGAAPTLSSLDRWRRANRRVHQAPTASRHPG